jgi:hypothetical protein
MEGKGMKLNFVEPSVEVISFAVEDVITASSTPMPTLEPPCL